MHNVDVRKLKFNFSGKVSPQKSNSSGKISQKVVCLHVKNKMFWQHNTHLIWYSVYNAVFLIFSS